MTPKMNVLANKLTTIVKREEGAWPPHLHAFLIIFTPRITFFAICMNVSPVPQNAKRGGKGGSIVQSKSIRVIVLMHDFIW